MPRLLAFLLTLLVGLAPLDVAAKSQPRIAVLELSGPLKAQELALMSDQIRAGVLTGLQGKPYVVMSRENMAAIAKDMNIDLSCAEGQCEVDTARNLGAAWVVSGALVQMGGMWMCTVKVHDVGTGGLKASGKVDGTEAVDLVDQLPPLAARLVGETIGSGGATTAPREVSVKPGESSDGAALVAQEAAKKAERDLDAEVEAERKRMAEAEAHEKAKQESEAPEDQAEPNKLEEGGTSGQKIPFVGRLFPGKKQKEEASPPQPSMAEPQRRGIMGSRFMVSFGPSVGAYSYRQESTVASGPLYDYDVVFGGGVTVPVTASGVDLHMRYLPGFWGGEVDVMALKYQFFLPEFQTPVEDFLNGTYLTGLIRWDAGVVRPALRLGVGATDLLLFYQKGNEEVRVLEYQPLVIGGATVGLEADTQVLERLYARVWIDFRFAGGTTYYANAAGLEVLYPIQTRFFIGASIKNRALATGVWTTSDNSSTKRQVGIVEDSLIRGVLSVGYMR